MLDKVKDQIRKLEYDFIISGRNDIKLKKNIDELKKIVNELEPKISFTNKSEMQIEKEMFDAFNTGKLNNTTFLKWYKKYKNEQINNKF